jgi:fibronectin-binding autotransporter adhesin
MSVLSDGKVFPTVRAEGMVWSTSLLTWVFEEPGSGGGGPATIADGADVAEGTTSDIAWSGAGSGTVIAILKKIASGGGGGGGPVTVADGADVTQGAIADAAVTTNTTGTVSGKLRGLVAILADVWNSGSHWLRVDGSGVTQPVSNAGLSNLDVALSTRLKPADTLTKVATVDTITNPVTVTGSVTASGTVTANQGTPAATASAWPHKITDGTTIADVLNLGTQPTDTNNGLVTVSAIHGHTTAGGGAYVDVKVTPSGSLAVDIAESGTVTVTGTVTANQGGAPWSQNLTQVGGSALTEGQKAMAASVPVVIASDQSAVPVSGTVAVSAVAGTVAISAAALPLPANAAQESGGNLASLVTQGALDQAYQIQGNERQRQEVLVTLAAVFPGGFYPVEVATIGA